MILKFSGLVETGDDCRVSTVEEDLHGAIIIGGIDVVDAIDNGKFANKVTVGILDELFDGELFVMTGWGYSEYTPMDSDTLRVGDHDLIEILSRYEGKEITVFVSDEPVNILE